MVKQRCCCGICGHKLTRDEIEFYGGTCDACERDFTAHVVDDCGVGAEDVDLDRLFNVCSDRSIH